MTPSPSPELGDEEALSWAHLEALEVQEEKVLYKDGLWAMCVFVSPVVSNMEADRS